MADASYPQDLLYHPEHDWARIDGDGLATFGITWYAQDALGEVVFFDPPAVGTTVSEDEPYAEVESVKAVTDVDRAAVRRDRRGQRGAGRRARRRSTTTRTARGGWSRSACRTHPRRTTCWTPPPTRRRWADPDRRIM